MQDSFSIISVLVKKSYLVILTSYEGKLGGVRMLIQRPTKSCSWRFANTNVYGSKQAIRENWKSYKITRSKFKFEWFGRIACFKFMFEWALEGVGRITHSNDRPKSVWTRHFKKLYYALKRYETLIKFERISYPFKWEIDC